MGQKCLSIPKLILMGFSSIALGLYLYVAFSRIAYPFTIEWVESNVFLQIVRVLQGKYLYVPPSYDFIPMIYTPLYYYVVAIFAKATSQILFSMRLVSILASMLTFTMIYALCRLREVTRELSLVAVGLYVASYGVTGYWLDVGRVDSLFLALLLTGYVLTIAQTKRDNIVGAIAGFVFFLSFATKQSALAALPFSLLHLLLKRRWLKSICLGISFLISCGLFVILMNIESNGWFWIYTFRIPSAHPLSWEIALHDLWTLHIFPNFSWLLIIIALSFCVLFVNRNKVALGDYAVFVLDFALPLVIMSIFAVAKQWGYSNGLMPMVAALSIVGAEAYQRIGPVVMQNSTREQGFKYLFLLASIIMVLQFGNLRYDFQTQIPPKTSLDAGYRILDILRCSKDPIFIPTSPYLLYLVHHQTHFHASSLGDVVSAAQHDSNLNQITEKYVNMINTYISSNSIRTAILPNAKWFEKTFSKENGYHCESLVSNYPRLITVTGAISFLDRICYRDSDSSR